MSMPYPPPPPLAPKNRGPWLIIGIVAAVIAVLCCGGIGVAYFIGLRTVEEATKPHDVRFEVTSEAGTAYINWSTLGDSAVESEAATPWSKEVQLEGSAGLAGVTATAIGTISCKLWVDGNLVDEGESEGVVNCSATIS
ncbi:MmpS family transport accessory protein [Polymorphospora lycopeni]|uniref:MmpS family transport accessory protein n=1 Tax=Polymorphospora lycopeni TaxID=3140240 RepID=A0ABV5CPA4_9ACTN